ncbi:MAG: XdhC/CoxI family protein [bacterium]
MPLAQPRLYAAIVELLHGRERGAVCTVVAVEGSVPGKLGAKMLVWPDGRQLGTVGGAGLEEQVRARAVESIASGASGLHHFTLAKWAPGGLNSICGGVVQIAIEVLIPPPHLLLCGGGHVAQAIAQAATPLEYQYSVLDDRPDFVTPALFPQAVDRIVGTPAALFGDSPLDLSRYSDIYLLGYSWELDTEYLVEILPRFDGFVGVIGSKTKAETMRRELSERGVAADRIARIVSPIGLHIGAESPAEIAVSVLADLIQRVKGWVTAP